jgi:hypothetical protein
LVPPDASMPTDPLAMLAEPTPSLPPEPVVPGSSMPKIDAHDDVDMTRAHKYATNLAVTDSTPHSSQRTRAQSFIDRFR